jgi:predicted DCC family thiol-disulfide oxidoreductase YuxK
VQTRDSGRRVLALPSQTAGLAQQYGLTREQTDRELWAIDPSGRLLSGAAAVNRVLAELGGGWSWLAGWYGLRPVRFVEDRAYRYVANHRAYFWFWTTTPACQEPGTQCE